MLKLLLAAAVACPRAVAINSKGAPSVEVTGIDGGNALYHAASRGHTACVGALLDHGATIDTICAEDGAAIGYHAQTALMGAVSGGRAETVAL